MTRFFDFMKAKLDFEPVLHWTNLLTFHGWLSIAEARSESRPAKARRYAVKSLDTDLHRLGTQCHLSGECHSQCHLLANHAIRNIRGSAL
jgi:hypothetical protein